MGEAEEGKEEGKEVMLREHRDEKEKILCDIVCRRPYRQVAEAKDVHSLRYLPKQKLLSEVQLCFESCLLSCCC